MKWFTILYLAIIFIFHMPFGKASPKPKYDKLAEPKTSSRLAGVEYRLSGDTTPLNYDVFLNLDPANNQKSFEGHVLIKIKARKAVQEIILHADDILVRNISVTDMTQERDVYLSHSFAKDDTDFMFIKLKEVLVAENEYYIDVEYDGNYGPSLDGIYISSYVNVNNEVRFLATTQFQATSARTAFPCYDEPGFKAPFQITIQSPAGYHSISNTEVAQAFVTPTKSTITVFEKTPIMSTYLIAFVVSDFEYITNEGQTDPIYPKKYRVSARPTAKSDLALGFDFGQKNLLALEQFTGVKFALSKMDNVAVPDFGAGAMENWGLITYTERYMLDRTGFTTSADKEEIVTTFSHENAHMWFGNEVTPVWWDYLWLSEGFATYFENYATDLTSLDYKMMDSFTVNILQYALWTDSFDDTNPMSNSVFSPSEIDQTFNTVAYQKSASVIRMIQHVMGDVKFQIGLQNYLKNNLRGLTEPSVLFKALDEVLENEPGILPEGIKMSEIFGSWSNQAGYPIVSVSRSPDGSFIEMKQERYFDDVDSQSDEQWWIPVNWASRGNQSFEDTTPMVWLKPSDGTLKAFLPSDEWYILNKQQTGFYRVMYDTENWKNLAAALSLSNKGGIHVLNRAQLLDDALGFSETFRLTYDITFDILNYLQNEVDYVPWAAAYDSLEELTVRLAGTEYFHLYQRFIKNLSQKWYDSLTINVGPSDHSITRQSRELAVTVSCGSGSQKCRTETENLLQAWINDPVKKIDVDLQEAVYCSALRSGNSQFWNFMWNQFKGTTEKVEIRKYLMALGCSENTDQISEFLAQSISDTSMVKDLDRHSVVEAVIVAGEKGFSQAFDFVIANFRQLQQKIKFSSGTTRIIRALGTRLVTQEHIAKFEKFVKDNDRVFTRTEKRAALESLEEANDNEEWLTENIATINLWLTGNVSTGY